MTGYIGFAVFIFLSVASLVIIPRISRSGEMLTIGNTQLPMPAFAGVVSAMANICIILMVVFYGKAGFIAALVLLLGQVPIRARNLIVTRQMDSLPGVFSTLLTVIVIIVIRSRDRKIVQFQQDKAEHLTKQKEQSERLFEQTALALVTAIDANARRIDEEMRKTRRNTRRSIMPVCCMTSAKSASPTHYHQERQTDTGRIAAV